MSRDLSRSVIALLLVAFLGALPAALALEPEHGGEGEEMSPEMAAMMETWQKAMTPGPQHEELAAGVGTWAVKSKLWMDPAGEPAVSEGSAVREMILDGRVLEERYTGVFMGETFDGIGRTGYDNVTGKYWSTWVDSMSTGCFMSHGSKDEETGVMTFTGEYMNPMSGEMTSTRAVLRYEGEDTQIFEWYEKLEGGEEARTMELTYTRQ